MIIEGKQEPIRTEDEMTGMNQGMRDTFYVK
jgi:hypothetical protein